MADQKEVGGESSRLGKENPSRRLALMSKHLSCAVGCAQAWSLELLRCREKDREGREKMCGGQRDEENMGELQSMFADTKMAESEK